LLDHLFDKYLNLNGELVLDIGCGTGLMVERLSLRGHQVLGLDVRPEGLQATRLKSPQSLLLQAEATSLPVSANSFNAIILLDVLEHVDDQKLLAEVERALQPGGIAFLTVPAMPWLWSYRDEAAGHMRRYTRNRLATVLSKARLRVKEMRYYQFLLFPLVASSRLLGRTSPRMRDFEDNPLPAFNLPLAWINKTEAKLSRYISWPWGSSLVAVCQKGVHATGV
jgi:ubiquinone/menaquinone biosynthesis C-methylase UbiE